MRSRRKKKKYSRRIKLPYSIIVGEKILNEVTTIARDFQSVLVVTGSKKTRKIAGKKVSKLLNCDIIGVTKPTVKESERVGKILEKEGIELVVGVGGGKVIDITKLAAFRTGIDYISVPTTCSNDGIASPLASLRVNGYLESVIANPPIGIVADIKILRKCPKKFTKAGIGDMISKYSAVRDWQLGHVIKGEYYGEYSSSLSLMVAEVITNSVDEIKKRSVHGINTLLEALISSGAAMGIVGSSRPASGSEHKFSHALDKLADFPALHGNQCGVGTIVMSYLQGADWRKVKNALDRAGCPTTAKDLGVSKDIALKAMLKAKDIKPERYTIIDHIKLDTKIARHALKTTGVI